MAADTWQELIGTVVEGRYRLRSLTYSGRDQAEYLADTAESQSRGEALTVTLIAAAPEEIDGLRSQLLIASRLQHPNMVRILSAGESAVEGRFMLYLASETPDQTLADALASGPLPKDAVRGLASHILGALSFLHDEGLVYRSLDPNTTVRANGRWKLADYGQVAPSGEPAPEVQSRPSPYWPPEAKTGPVTAAWDIWAFGVLLRHALTGQVSKVRRLPRPFEDIVEGCLQTQPERRLTAQQIRRMLEPPGVPGESAEVADSSGVAARPAVAAPIHVSTRTHLNLPAREGLWRSLRVLALIALACLILVLPFSLRKKPAQPAGVEPASSAAAPAAKATAAHAPAAKATEPTPATLREQAGRAGIAKADYISRKMNGRRTASGERFDSNALTAATRAYPIGTRIRVTNLKNSKSVVVRVNDRGRRGRTVGLTERAAKELGISQAGTAEVLLEVMN
jgi:rare lipoprotein A